ncbi:MAG: threonylcarbamoyl-AMP synthase [Acidimicrobiia bacterium]|nr:threonylcarbamoyl-AMP synthase [Acidimicrobiia bacterium]
MVTADVARAAECLAAGGLVAIPTETVYGLGADAGNEAAVARVYAAKGRPAGHPVIVHIAAAAELAHWAAHIHHVAATLADACWPGPLTLLLRRAPGVSDTVTGGRDTVGLRVPAHPLTLELMTRSGRAIAAPSANRFGRVSPTTAAHVLADLGDRLDPATDVILDGGPCPVGVESTIVDCTTEPPQLLRPGGISAEDVERLIDADLAAGDGPVRAAGMLATHYAPRARVELVEDAATAERRVADLLLTGPRALVLDGGDDLVAAARQLYSRLRAADDDGADVIVAVLPPARGLGHAIRDRLAKAASR